MIGPNWTGELLGPSRGALAVDQRVATIRAVYCRYFSAVGRPTIVCRRVTSAGIARTTENEQARAEQ